MRWLDVDSEWGGGGGVLTFAVEHCPGSSRVDNPQAQTLSHRAGMLAFSEASAVVRETVSAVKCRWHEGRRNNGECFCMHGKSPVAPVLLLWLGHLRNRW